MQKKIALCATLLVLFAASSTLAAPKFDLCMSANGAISAKRKCSKKEVKLSSANLGTYGIQGATGPAGATGPQGAQGLQGAAGSAGADGQMRIYGDGSAGDVTISTNVSWAVDPNSRPYNNFQFHNLTVQPAGMLSVQSGVVIRCTGTFQNFGTIQVGTAAAGGGSGLGAGPNGLDGLIDASIGRPSEGISLRAASAGEFGTIAHDRWHGAGGRGVSSDSLMGATILRPGVKGGGGGAGTIQDLYSGGSGGGVLTILAKGGINLDGDSSIRAKGGNGLMGGGGGGGGIVILASSTSITWAGTISILGGNGGDAINNGNIVTGAGGGGGGGLIHLISPIISDSSNFIEISGGFPGNNDVPDWTGATHLQGGGGGGACAANGGYGSDVRANHTVDAALAGYDGVYYKDLIDPTALF